MLKFTSALCFLLLVFSPLMAEDRDISKMSSGGALKPLQANMDIRHYTLALDVDIPIESINGYAVIDFLLTAPTDTLLFDLVRFLDVTAISSGKRRSNFSVRMT